MQGEMMLRRLALVSLAAGLAMIGTLALSGAAGAATPAVKPKPGGVWTLEVVGAACEVQTFAAGGVWTADKFGDSGTYVDGVNAAGHKTVKETWTAGNDAGLTFKGTKAAGAYSGPLGGTGAGQTATLTLGVTAGC